MKEKQMNIKTKKRKNTKKIKKISKKNIRKDKIQVYLSLKIFQL